jgi:ubiquinone/menaquinone biosynthesis C-methylase UbiE
MAQIGKFTQPDNSPAYFINFLEFLDKREDIRKIRTAAARHLNLSPGQKVLDLGCGIGGATFPLAEITGPAGLAAGVDISSAMVEAAKSRIAGRTGVEFCVGEACAIPYPDGFFDAARSERVFLYLPDRIGAIGEIKRVLKPGGKLMLLDVDLDATGVYSHKLALARKMTSIVAATMPNPNSARDLPALARKSGLKDLRVELFGLQTPHEFFLKVMAGSLKNAVEQGTAPAAEVEEFLEEQASLEASGDFFQAWYFVLVSGTV